MPQETQVRTATERQEEMASSVLRVFGWVTTPLRMSPGDAVPHPAVFLAVVCAVVALSILVAAAAVVYVFVGLPCLYVARSVQSKLLGLEEEPLGPAPHF